MRKHWNYNILALLILPFNIAHAEEWMSFSLVDLSFFADTVVEATYLDHTGGDYEFLIRDLQGANNQDTLVVNGIDGLFEGSFLSKLGFKTAEKIILYLSYDEDGRLVPTWSGFRLFQDYKVHSPIQVMNPGSFAFASSQDSISWEELKHRVLSIQERIRKVKQLKQIQDLPKRNQALFSWLKRHKHTFGKACRLNEDCGWGFIEQYVFEWIAESNIAKDIWRASKWYIAIHAQAEVDWYSDQILSYGSDAFSSYEDIEFLLAVATDSTQATLHRKQALFYLKTASKKVYENNIPIPDSTTLAFQKNKQQSIRELILPALENDQLKDFAFPVIAELSYPSNQRLKHRIDLQALPALRMHYKNEDPSWYKRKLAHFLVRHSSEAEWKQLTNSDANIFMDIQHVLFDTTSKVVSVRVYYDNGEEAVLEEPELNMVKAKSGSEVFRQKLPDFKLPFSKKEFSTVQVQLEGLEKGQYQLYLSGKAGEHSRFFWQSEMELLEVK